MRLGQCPSIWTFFFWKASLTQRSSVVPIILKLRIIACKFQYFASIFLYFHQYQVKLFTDRLCMFPELNDLLHKQQNFSIFITDVKVTFHLKICVN